VLLLASIALAHDLWLAPASLVAAPGPAPAVVLRLGEDLIVEEERPLEAVKATRWVHAWKGRNEELLRDGALTQIGTLRRGWHALAMDRTPAVLELPADRFRAYLAEEGLLQVVARRDELGEREAPGRERYRRCLKALVRVGEARSAGWDARLGQPLELVAAANPASVEAGAEWRVRVWFQDAPLRGARLRLTVNGAAGPRSVDATSDAEGYATFVAPGAGDALVTMVHMQRAQPGDTVEWESWWGALSLPLGR
jgi:uncharacterized GH25 family protein